MDNTNICDRAEDLIGFLYGELSETEARQSRASRARMCCMRSRVQGFWSNPHIDCRMA